MNRFPRNFYVFLAAQGAGLISFLLLMLCRLTQSGRISSADAVSWFLGGAAVLLVFSGGAVLVFRITILSRMRRLADEARRIQEGEEPLGPLTGNDGVARLSWAFHRVALRQRDLREAVDEHAIVAVTDRQGRIVFVNDRFCSISGYSREELLGQTHRIINSGKHPPEFFARMWKTISAGQVWKGTIENRAKKGSHYFVATTIVPVPGADGKPEQYIAVRTDITEQKSRTEQLGLLSRELKAKNRDLEILIHAASHDLRTPLVNVLGFAAITMAGLQSLRELLIGRQDGLPPPAVEVESILGELSEALKFIGAGAEKMDALLEGLLAFSKLGRKAPELCLVLPGKIVEESLAATKFQLEAAGAEVIVNPLPECLADPGLLGQVVSNLIDNAIKYRDPSRPLRFVVSGFRKEGLSIYQFEDNGIGIPERHHSRVFELFHRLDPGKAPGHGLGLAIVRRAVDRMGGSVAVEAAAGHGTIFSITLSTRSQDGTVISENLKILTDK